MKDKIIAKSFNIQLYDIYKIEDMLINEIFTNYLANENLNINEKNKYIINIIKNKLLALFIDTSIFEPKIINYDYDPHNFNEYGIYIKNLKDSITLSIKTNNNPSVFEEIIENEIKYYSIGITLWIDKKLDITYNEFKNILELLLINLKKNNNIFKYDYTITIFNNNYSYNYNYNINDTNAIYSQENNTMNSSTSLSFFHSTRIIINFLYKFDEHNIQWKQLKTILNFDNYLSNESIIQYNKNIIKNIINNIFIDYIV